MKVTFVLALVFREALRFFEQIGQDSNLQRRVIFAVFIIVDYSMNKQTRTCFTTTAFSTTRKHRRKYDSMAPLQRFLFAKIAGALSLALFNKSIIYFGPVAQMRCKIHTNKAWRSALNSPRAHCWGTFFIQGWQRRVFPSLFFAQQMLAVDMQNWQMFTCKTSPVLYTLFASFRNNCQLDGLVRFFVGDTCAN